MFHKEGYQIILGTLLLVLIVNALSYSYVQTAWLQNLIFGITAVLLILILQFFRNPKRSLVEDDDAVMAPVDGKVVVIEEVQENEYFKEKRLQVSVFMSPLNVHVTRHPVSGKVKYSKYHPGKYLVAWHPKSSEKNERTTVVVETPVFGGVLYRQIAGAMARRIVNYAKIGDQVVQGSDSGFIKFGSRVDVFLPLDAEIKVTLGQIVKGAETIIAKHKSHG